MSLLSRDTREETVRYALAGCLSSGANLVTFYLLRHLAGLDYLLCNTAAWVVTVLVAYAANKLLVFRAVSMGRRALLREFVAFVGSRLFSGGLDLLLMWGLVAGLGWNVDLVKLLTSAVVTVCNYLVSKLLVFRPRRTVPSD